MKAYFANFSTIPVAWGEVRGAKRKSKRGSGRVAILRNSVAYSSAAKVRDHPD
jgi:hypothetical protein